MKRFSIIFFSFLYFNLYAQEATIRYNEPPAIKKLLQQYYTVNEVTPNFEGWTVLLATTTDRRKIEEMTLKAKEDFPGIVSDWVHDRPYYKLYSGAFRTKNEAVRHLKKVKVVFPTAYLSKDAIKKELALPRTE